jgi:Berberine and berberine like
MGWLTRTAGLTIDNLVSAEVVLADGAIVRAAADEEPDLFWALRGGGGNFGVVTEFEFRCHAVGPMIQFGMFFWGLDQGVEAMRFMRDLGKRLPREITPLGRSTHRPPLFEFVTPMPFTGLQQMFDDANGWGQYYYEKSAYIAEITDDVIDVVTEQVPRKTSPLTVMLWYQLDQAYTEAGEDDTAFAGGRTPRHGVFLVAAAPVPEMLPADRAWAREFADALRPLTINDTTYVNAMTEYDEERVRASYGAAKYERLAGIKGRYDPGNVFHRNINIKPA